MLRVYTHVYIYNHGILGMMLKLERTILHVYVSSTGLRMYSGVATTYVYVIYIFPLLRSERQEHAGGTVDTTLSRTPFPKVATAIN